MDLFGPALGALKARNLLILWLRGVDLNHRPLGYEPNELPDCSTPHFDDNNRFSGRQTCALFNFTFFEFHCLRQSLRSDRSERR